MPYFARLLLSVSGIYRACRDDVRQRAHIACALDVVLTAQRIYARASFA